MSTIPEAVARLCEDAQSYSPGWSGSELIRLEHVHIWLGPPIYPGLSVVLHVRIADGGVEAAVERVRSFLRERGRTRANWMVGSSATPADAVERLRDLGLRDDIDPVLKGVVLDRPPDAEHDAAIEVVRVDRREQLHDFFRIQQEAFGTDRNASEGGDRFVDDLFDAEAGTDTVTTYLAYLDGEPVATARATFADVGVVLNGGSTLYKARRRGAYRALVAARWDDAVARGTPFLTTIARPSSYPILKAMGFTDVCEVRVLNDEF